MALHPKYTLSQRALHLTVHFISQVISSHMLLHPIRYFIPPVISSYTSLYTSLLVYESLNPASQFIPVNTSCLILFFQLTDLVRPLSLFTGRSHLTSLFGLRFKKINFSGDFSTRRFLFPPEVLCPSMRLRTILSISQHRLCITGG